MSFYDNGIMEWWNVWRTISERKKEKKKKGVEIYKGIIKLEDFQVVFTYKESAWDRMDKKSLFIDKNHSKKICLIAIF